MPQSPQEDLLHALDTTNTSGIYAVHFIPNEGKPFNVMTKRMKQISLYVTNKLQKTEFAPGELEGLYHHVVQYLPSELPQAEKAQLQDILGKFVQEGGRVEFTPYSVISFQIFMVPFMRAVIIISILGALHTGLGWLMGYHTGGKFFFLVGIVIGSITYASYLQKSTFKYTVDVLKRSTFRNVIAPEPGDLLKVIAIIVICVLFPWLFMIFSRQLGTF